MRQRRLWEPGSILSVVGRAHEGRPIFAADDDRRFFVDRIRRVFASQEGDLLAWALLVNHYHLMVRVGDAPPERLFRRLNTALGMRARRKLGDQGTVFQGRYWSRPCVREGSVQAALTYVLGNPVHHGILPTAEILERYEWTAYPEILGLASQGLVDAAGTLALIHPDPVAARGVLRDAMAVRAASWQSQRLGIDICEEPGCRGARDGCHLVHTASARRTSTVESPGGSVTPWRPFGVSRVHDEQADRRTRLRAAGWTPSDLIAPVCALLGADAVNVRAGGRRPAECAARAAIAFIACDCVGISAESLAEIVGVSGAAIGAARPRGRAIVATQGWDVDEVLARPGLGR